MPSTWLRYSALDNQERIMRSIASSLQEIAQSTVQINNRLAEIGKVIKEKESTTDGD